MHLSTSNLPPRVTVNTGKTSARPVPYTDSNHPQGEERQRLYVGTERVDLPDSPKTILRLAQFGRSQEAKGTRRVRGSRKDPLKVDQARKLLERLRVDKSLEGVRDHTLINLLPRTGFRRTEVVRASVGDIRQESEEAALWIQEKEQNAKDGFLILTHEMLGPIHDYLRARGGAREKEPLFTSLSDRNRNDRLTAHSLRHSAGTFALKAKA